MNREIKFRVWCKDKNQWEEDYCVLTSDGVLLHRVRSLWVPLNKDTHIIQFCTGLKDKNDKEIFEGDIVIYDDYNGEIYWNEEIAIFELNYDGTIVTDFDHIYPKELEVISNIYENSELLEVDNEQCIKKN